MQSDRLIKWMMLAGLLSTTAFANTSPKLFQYVGSSRPSPDNQIIFRSSQNPAVACPASIDTQNAEYTTVPASENALFKSAVGGGLTPGVHQLTKVSVYVATQPGYVGFIACRYGHVSPKYDYVIYQNTHNPVQYIPAAGAWTKEKGQIGYDATCTSTPSQCTFKVGS